MHPQLQRGWELGVRLCAQWLPGGEWLTHWARSVYPGLCRNRKGTMEARRKPMPTRPTRKVAAQKASAPSAPLLNHLSAQPHTMRHIPTREIPAMSLFTT